MMRKLFLLTFDHSYEAASMFYLKDLYIYPVKSLGGVRLDKSLVEEQGLQYDRRWMLVDKDNKFISQRRFPILSQVDVSMASGVLILTHRPEHSTIEIPLVPESGKRIQCQIWEDTVDVAWPQLSADAWLSDIIGQSCRLVYLPASSSRRVDPDYVPEQVNTSLSDGYPYLLTNTASLDDLIIKSGFQMSMKRFRPNLVVDVEIPWIEDSWRDIRIGEVSFRSVKPCGRCIITTIDPESGFSGSEPLATLAKYRNQGNKVIFGQNMIARSRGWIEVGAGLTIL